ncbi:MULTISPECIES: acyl carrier protein [Micromonospora]|uniref:Acyl carrier protein n=1 Tax=Micromonospora antibiotica TaxID=2807623 RepID=A0ABS3V299_9ACTN|nr:MULTISPECIES: acyl carrier protein [Micromonospora]MBO4159728.1 acyl carrier protein [Micromonospora antibiotica]MBW4704210.1 acyl carrier protein [Micromonospora sp. RL09-050-HVF-A]
MSESGTRIRQKVARIITESAEGGLSEADLDRAGGSLPALGYSSLSYIRMIDAIENTFGIEIDQDEEDDRLRSVDGIVALVAAQDESAHV